MRAETLRAFERHLVAAAARPQTIATYVRIARAFLTSLDQREAGQAVHGDVEGFLARPRRTGAPASTSTRNLELVALRALFRSRGGADPTEGFSLKRPDHRHPDVPTTTELAALFQRAALEPARERALAILVLLFQAGLRVHELAALDVEQVDLGAGVLLAVAGKNATRYEIPLGPEAIALVGEWIALHPTGSGPLFPSASPHAPRASVRSIQRLLARLRHAAGLAKRITPHSLRHATATEAIGRGVSLPATAALMRHARVETTMLYVALVSTARRDAATRIGAAIPRSVLPVSRNHSEFPSFGGVHDAVDAEDDLRDAA
jgi:integrase/recombinase XerC